jgi:uncharacterized glyoxalase superfamily protein PhnB
MPQTFAEHDHRFAADAVFLFREDATEERLDAEGTEVAGRGARADEALGFGVAERWEENGTLLGAMLQAGELMIGLSQDDWKKGRDRQKGVGARIYIETTQPIDEIAARARDAGVTLDSEPHDTEMKTRQFEVTDPSGFKLTVSSEWPR